MCLRPACFYVFGECWEVVWAVSCRVVKMVPYCGSLVHTFDLIVLLLMSYDRFISNYSRVNSCLSDDGRGANAVELWGNLSYFGVGHRFVFRVWVLGVHLLGALGCFCGFPSYSFVRSILRKSIYKGVTFSNLWVLPMTLFVLSRRRGLGFTRGCDHLAVSRPPTRPSRDSPSSYPVSRSRGGFGPDEVRSKPPQITILLAVDLILSSSLQLRVALLSQNIQNTYHGRACISTVPHNFSQSEIPLCNLIRSPDRTPA